ncbi:DUF58 domain-containing protein [Microbacterium sp.]|uniref:DUF58 domain-containing protein n=1 Tax=Microbacterium sp. TaxID=51671 RepID=UPI003A90A7E4
MPAPLSPAPFVGAGVGVVLMVVAIGVGRPDLAVIGVVLLAAVATALAIGRRTTAARTVLRRGAAGPEASTPTGHPVVTVAAGARAPGAELVTVTATVLAHRTERLVLAAPRGTATLRLVTVHSGDQQLVTAETRAVGADGAWASPTPTVARLTARIVPPARPMPFLPLPRVPSGLTGEHDAARPGDGGEFRDIHPFATGDRLRRIDWKATARLARRPGDLFVRRTFATADIDVALILDDAEDVTGMPGDWLRADRSLQVPTSMDVAREASWSIACAYLDAGDQVSFQVLSRLGSAVPRGSGARQRERLRASIATATAAPRTPRRRTPLVAAGALVVLLSTFLDDESVRLVELWRAAGHRVLAVDILPQLRSERLRREEIAASRIVLGLRADRLADVVATGADLLAWDGSAGARTAALRAMARVRRRR